MKNKQLILPEISSAEKTPLVEALLSVIQEQFQTIQQQFQEIQELRQEVRTLKDEVARLNRQKPRPSMLPGKLETKKTPDESNESFSKRPGSEKRSLTKTLQIHEEKEIRAENVPTGSIRNGYQDFVVRDVIIKAHNIKLRLERWLTPDGKYLVAKLPEEYKNGHIGPGLKRLILMLSNGSTCATQPALKELLDSMDIDISTGQIAHILTDSEDLDIFHKEKDAILAAGIQTARYLTTDDTGWRHKSSNYFSNYIGNPFFAWFGTSPTKSRIQFLTHLALGEPTYVIDEKALDYMRNHRVSQLLLSRIALELGKEFGNEKSWKEFLVQEIGLKNQEYRITTEGALTAGLLKQGFPESMVILSDDAKQFNVFVHALCWVHAERPLRKLIPINDEMLKAINTIRNEIWAFYESLKQYRKQPSDEAKIVLNAEFDPIFTQNTPYLAINKIIASIYKNKAELLVVLDRPEVPLHNNASEQAMHGPVKKRKISRGSKSDSGLQCRDTLASLKETCRKLGVSFWDYVLDRLVGAGKVPYLPDLIREKATAALCHNTS
jgi:hypothetical protein